MISIQLDDETVTRAQRLAVARQCTVEELLKQLLAASEPKPQAHANEQSDTGECGLIGMLADEPELVNQLLEDIYRTRENTPLRLPVDGPDAT